MAYLDGIDTPYLEQQQGFTVDGAAFKVRIDAGVAPLDWRRLVKVTKNNDRRGGFFILKAALVAFSFMEKNMANNYQQDGTTLDYHNAGVDAVSSGALVTVGGIAGVAHSDILLASGETLHMAGVFCAA